MDVSQIAVAGFSTDGDDVPGCATGGPQAAGSITIQVGEDEGILLLSLPNSWLYGKSLCKTNRGDE